jgi:hypothetical protein
MARSDNKDPKLSEVKAVLQRLQGFEAEADVPAILKPVSAGPRSGLGVAVAAWTVILATAIGLLGAVYLFVLTTGPAPEPPRTAEEAPARTASVAQSPPRAQEPGPPPSSQPTDPSGPELKAALEGARALMAKGRVRAAREQLLALASKGSPDAAWDLARSYDPNVLAALQADASPDVKEAARWYRAWYAAAVREGLVADSVSLERIIGSMLQ